MSKYANLIQVPPVITVKSNAREVHINTISAMCDNEGKLSLCKNDHGDFKLYGNGFALSNWQMDGDFKTDIEWAADDGNWNDVINIINTGTSVVESARSR